jgi:hypothetical protein
MVVDKAFLLKKNYMILLFLRHSSLDLVDLFLFVLTILVLLLEQLLALLILHIFSVIILF